MLIKKLSQNDLKEAIQIKKECFKEDYKELVPVTLDVEKETKELEKWLNDQTTDIRKIYGAYENHDLVGFIVGSFSEEEDSLSGVEINYFFIKKAFRGLGIGLKLLRTILVEYYHYGISEVIIYSLHEAPSNQFYQGLNPTILRQDIQDFKGKKNLVDIFKWNLKELAITIKDKLKDRPLSKGGFHYQEDISNHFSITSKHSQEDIDYVCKGLLDYNVKETDGVLRKPNIPLNLFARDGDKIIGAILCDNFSYCLYIDVMWVDENYRRTGIGKRLITKAEEIAKENGCTFSHTTTFSYQGPLFYQACGYEVFATLDDYPNGIVQYFLKKKL